MAETKNEEFTFDDVLGILKNINFSRHSCIDMEWKFDVVDKESTEGLYLIRTCFWRKDIITGEPDWGWGRWHTTPAKGATEKSIVMTAWVCVKMIVEHELLEGFEYHEKKVFDPHKPLSALVYPETLPNER